MNAEEARERHRNFSLRDYRKKKRRERKERRDRVVSVIRRAEKNIRSASVTSRSTAVAVKFPTRTKKVDRAVLFILRFRGFEAEVFDCQTRLKPVSMGEPERWLECTVGIQW